LLQVLVQLGCEAHPTLTCPSIGHAVKQIKVQS